jgi:hypothetical protein
MGVFDKIHLTLGRKGNEGAAAEQPVTVTAAVHDKDQEAGVYPDDGSTSDAVTENAQHGVQTVEATTLAWSKKALAGVFVLYVFVWMRSKIGLIPV